MDFNIEFCEFDSNYDENKFPFNEMMVSIGKKINKLEVSIDECCLYTKNC